MRCPICQDLEYYHANFIFNFLMTQMHGMHAWHVSLDSLSSSQIWSGFSNSCNKILNIPFGFENQLA